MNKAELTGVAESLGLKVEADATNAAIRAAIETEQARIEAEATGGDEAADQGEAGSDPEGEKSKDLDAEGSSDEADEAGPTGDAPKAEDAPDGVTAADPVVKSGGRKVRVRKFFGSFKNALFMEDKAGEFGICENIDDETLGALRAEYPGAEIEEL